MTSTKQEINEIFQEYLVGALGLDDSFLLEEFNGDIIDLIIEDKEYNKNLSQLLLNSREKLTYKTFVLDEKEIRPTVAGWLKDFIREQGAEMPDNLKISQYLTKARNAQNLDAAEKNLVKKLLNLYRNLNFFPDSMPGEDIASWAIFPLAKEEALTKVRKVESKKLKVKSDNTQDDRITQLRNLADEYAQGSLERKAIEEEIRKLQGTSGK